MGMDFDEAFEAYRATRFGAYAPYPIEAYTHFGAGWNAAIEACRQAQPCTAEKPDENPYQRGRFDGVMEYGRAILGFRRGGSREAT